MSGMTSAPYNQDFLLETLGIAQEFLSDIIYDIQVIGSFEPEIEYFWNYKVTKLIENTVQFVELSTLLTKKFLSQKKLLVQDIKASHIHLLFIIKGINQARQKQDFVALEDLIKYELKDNLTQWKIDFIQEAKKALNT